MPPDITREFLDEIVKRMPWIDREYLKGFSDTQSGNMLPSALAAIVEFCARQHRPTSGTGGVRRLKYDMNYYYGLTIGTGLDPLAVRSPFEHPQKEILHYFPDAFEMEGSAFGECWFFKTNSQLSLPAMFTETR